MLVSVLTIGYRAGYFPVLAYGSLDLVITIQFT
jgi:hypothetical protein